MRRVRLIGLVAFGLAALSVVLLTTSHRPPISASAIGRRSNNSEVGYLFSVTNNTKESLDVLVSRDNAPKEGMVGAFTARRLMQPRAVWTAALYPPEEGVPWSATVLYLRRAGKFEARLRRAGAWLGLCKSEPQWNIGTTIEIEK
jgi:hypothetical protein